MKNLSLIGLLVALGATGWLWNENRNLTAQLESSDHLVGELTDGRLVPFDSYNAHKRLAKELNDLLKKPDPLVWPTLFDILKKYRGLNGLCTDVPCDIGICCDVENVSGIIIPGTILPRQCVQLITIRDSNGTPIPCPGGVIQNGSHVGGVMLMSDILQQCGAYFVTSSCPPPLDTLWKREDRTH